MSNERILVVDDEPDIRELVREILEDEGYAVTVAADAETAREARNEVHPDLALLDIWMPGTDGITLLKEWQDAAAPRLPVIMMSGHGTIETAVEATRLGAFDFIEKPLSLSKLLLTVRSALERGAARASATERSPVPGPELVGTSPQMRQLRQRIRQLGASTAPALVRGEPGSGRRTAARMIHAQSLRAGGPLIELDLGTAAEATREVALFGSDGAWSRAAGGSLILYDIAELDEQAQGTLVARMGAGARDDTPRLIAITGEALEQRVEQQRFRSELFHGLAATVTVPPLREHVEDVPDLATHFVDRLVQEEGLSYRHLPVAAQNRLRHHPWPGNVAELRGVIQRLLILAESEREIPAAEVERVLEHSRPPTPPASAMPLPLDLPLREAREAFERAYLEHQLRAVGGRIGELAHRVGMERTHLYRKLKSLGIDYHAPRSRG